MFILIGLDRGRREEGERECNHERPKVWYFGPSSLSTSFFEQIKSNQNFLTFNCVCWQQDFLLQFLFLSQVCCGALWIGMSPSPHGRSPETIRSTTVNYFSSNIKARSKDWYGCNTNKQVLIFRFRKKHTVEPPVYFWYSTDYEIYIYQRHFCEIYHIFHFFYTDISAGSMTFCNSVYESLLY